MRRADGSRVQTYGGSYYGWYLAGEFMRAPVRPIAEALGYAVSFAWAADKSNCLVKLTEVA